ncbi:fatty-acyl-CoA synthase [Nakamurella panacisegetis]|uniref:Fatty-acyl-CoA synthase n=1 Tax=Nakamurella panacisegetis TaxID=1090615 RepID=A0A1H0IL82_9ACTN|nr:fatty acyl-AMP ligase [Nakamurella panacisegetis]SDO32239.1 fatty-acyl-CoA synthase [Nakamurella panacisegetis]
MSAFVDALRSAALGDAGMTTGEPRQAVRTGWGEIHQRALGGAAVLAARGLRKGQAVAILAGTPAEVAPAAQSVWLAGGSVTMLHQPTARTKLEHYAAETMRTLTVIDAHLVIVGEPFTELGGLLAGTGIGVVTVAELTAGDPAAAPTVDVTNADPALLQLTSGSTASPKAVRITHGNLWANIEAMCATARLRAEDDVMVSWLPLFHDMGMVGFLTLPMCRGIELVTVTPQDFLGRPLLWPELISKYRGTVTAAPNFAYALTARVLARPTTGAQGSPEPSAASVGRQDRPGEAEGAPPGLDLSSLRFALNGAEPIDVGAVRGFLAAGARFGLSSTAVVCAYGMAEATLGVSFHPWGTPLKVDTVDADALENHRRATPADPEGAGTRSFPVLGPPLPGIEAVAFDEDGVPLGNREVGVLHLRGESITELYLTVDGPRPTRGPGGWLDTGDLGYLVDGEVVVCGRVKDVIIMGGRNIYPTDIERVAEGVDGVRAGNAVAVRWLENGRRESFAVAVESREAADPVAVERISAGVRSAVTAAIGARPALVAVLPVGTLPKTPSGKLQRSAASALLV